MVADFRRGKAKAQLEGCWPRLARKGAFNWRPHETNRLAATRTNDGWIVGRGREVRSIDRI